MRSNDLVRQPTVERAPQPDQTQGMVREAEASKARVLEMQGRTPTLLLNVDNFDQIESNHFMQTVIMDEDYLIVAAHVDEVLERRIRNGEFIDFACLLPQDRVQMQQDNRVELVNHNGHLSCAPVAETTAAAIGPFQKWEQAFCVFSNIYTRQFPQRVAELIQYNHVIHTAAITYAWNNVYAYDIDFRSHMARHPQRYWNVILQQAWNLRLKDRQDSDRRGGSGYNSGKKCDICWMYNRGKCTYGDRCKFDHKCGICGKYRHRAHICHRGSRDWDKDANKKYDKFDRNDRRDRHRKDRDYTQGGGNAVKVGGHK